MQTFHVSFATLMEHNRTGEGNYYLHDWSLAHDWLPTKLRPETNWRSEHTKRWSSAVELPSVLENIYGTFLLLRCNFIYYFNYFYSNRNFHTFDLRKERSFIALIITYIYFYKKETRVMTDIPLIISTRCHILEENFG